MRPSGSEATAWKWLVIVAAGVLLVAAVARLTERRADVRLSFRAGSDAEAAIRVVTAGGRAVPLASGDDAADRRVVITTTGSGTVSMLPPFTSQGGRLVDLSQYTATEGDWRVVGDWDRSRGWSGGEWTASRPGSTLSWSGHAPFFELEFKTSPLGGGVEVVADGVALPPITLAGPDGTKRVGVGTRRRLATGMLDVADLPATIELPSDAEPISVAIVSDGHTVHSAELPADVRAVPLPAVPHASGFTYARRAAVLVTRGVCVNGLFLLLGAPLCLSLFARRSAVVAATASWAAGMSLVILFATSLTYVLPGAEAVTIALGGLSIVGIAVAVAQRAAAREALATTTGGAWLLVLLAAGIAGSLFAFAPAITEDGWFLGQSLTDSMDYIAWSERLVGSSLGEAGIAPWRIADLTTLVTISTLNGVDAREGYALAGFTLLVMLPLLTHAILEVLEAPAAAAACGAALSASMSIYPQLFDFSYFAQYVNSFVLHAGILAACILLDGSRPAPRFQWWATQCALAGPLALGIAMYPYQAIPAVILMAGLFVGWLRRRTRSGAALLATQVTLAAALSNRSLGIGVDFFQSKLGTFGFLDALARNIVFPFHASFRFIAIVAGCRDITMNHTYWPSLFAVTGGVPWWMPLYASSPFMVAVVVGLLAAMVAGLAVLAARRTAPATYVVTVYAAFLLATLALFATHHTYSYGKYMLACGTLAAVPAATGLAWMARGTRVGFWCVTAFLATHMFFNMTTTLLDQGLLDVSRASPFLFNKRTHLAAVDVAVRDLDRWSRSLPPGCRIVVIGNYARGSHADTDRVLYNRMLHALRGADVAFHEPHCPVYTAAVQFGTTELPVDGCRYDYAVVLRGYERLYEPGTPAGHDDPGILDNAIFRVYRGFRGTRRCAERMDGAASL
jgi:hypothetical protein